MLVFLLVIVGFGVAVSVVGVNLINRMVLNEAQTRVDFDLRAAWTVLESRKANLEKELTFLSQAQLVRSACASREFLPLKRTLSREAVERGLDFLGVTDANGVVMCRGVPPFGTGDDQSLDPLVRRAIEGGRVSGFEIIPRERLDAEGEDLARRAYMVFEPTAKAKPRRETAEESGMVIEAAVPVEDDSGTVIGTVYGGILLNRNHKVADAIRNLVFRDELYEGKHVGTVTIFQWDLRIATNVLNENGNRAIGTRVSSQVYDQVLENGRSWYDRAFVVNDWYLSAYEPMRNISGDVIGMLYLGILEQKYVAMKGRLVGTFISVTVLAVVIALVLSYVLARRVVMPVKGLVKAAGMIAAGNLEHRVPEIRSRDEIRDLTHAFNTMTEALEKRTEELEAANERLGESNERLHKLNTNYMDMLGFVTHELKSPIATSSMAVSALSGEYVGTLNERQKKLVDNIKRNLSHAIDMVGNYLDLSRIEKNEVEVKRREVALREDVIEPVLADFAEPIEEGKVTIEHTVPAKLTLMGDPDLLKVVYSNLVSNALKYGKPGGKISVGCERIDGEVRCNVWNEGVGVSHDKLDLLFQKFARATDPTLKTKKGTGLGLFITKDIIERHGGHIHAESEQGSWINFIFTMPVV